MKIFKNDGRPGVVRKNEMMWFMAAGRQNDVICGVEESNEWFMTACLHSLVSRAIEQSFQTTARSSRILELTEIPQNLTDSAII